jgi:hypothetical protein
VAVGFGVLALGFAGLVSCSGSEGDHTTTTVGSAGTNATGAAGVTATGAAGTSATGAAGTSATGAAGTSATGAAGTAAGGASGGAGTGGGSVFNGPFECTLVAGLLVTGEWYNAGFENDGVDGTKWEGRFVHYGYIDIWAQDPPGGFTWTMGLTSPCTKNSTAPDRVVFTAWSWELAYMKDKYVQTTAEAVRKFIKNYPSMKRMDLMTIVRCPGDETTNVTGKMCNPNAAIPPKPGVTDHNAGQQDCYVNPEVDQALTEVAAMFPGLVTVGKKFYSPACRAPVDGAHLGNNNTQVAKDIANYYKTMP